MPRSGDVTECPERVEDSGDLGAALLRLATETGAKAIWVRADGCEQFAHCNHLFRHGFGPGVEC